MGEKSMNSAEEKEEKREALESRNERFRKMNLLRKLVSNEKEGQKNVNFKEEKIYSVGSNGVVQEIDETIINGGKPVRIVKRNQEKKMKLKRNQEKKMKLKLK